MPADPQDILRRLDKAKDHRRTWEWHWEEVANLVMPTREFVTKYKPGGDRRNWIFDSTAPIALTRLAAMMHSLLTNPAIRWFQLAAEDPRVNQNRAAQIWLEDSTQRMLAIFNNPASNLLVR